MTFCKDLATTWLASKGRWINRQIKPYVMMQNNMANVQTNQRQIGITEKS